MAVSRREYVNLNKEKPTGSNIRRPLPEDVRFFDTNLHQILSCV